MRLSAAFLFAFLTLLIGWPIAVADVGDPQVRTDHPWYAGELSCSTFERLEETQGELYRWIVGEVPQTDDGGVYAGYHTVEYLAGYGGAPPMVHLRRGESLRRYHAPGLEDGQTFVFWGRNYNTSGIPGPERSRTWVNQPEKMYRSEAGAGYHPGQARYANAVYLYEPDFRSNDDREGVVDEDLGQVTFDFYTPYIIAATPPNDEPWGIYDDGCRNGMVVEGRADCDVSISTDRGQTWQACGRLAGELDLTDHAKGRRQYLLRFSQPASSATSISETLADAGVRITTVCQANSSTIPQLRDGETEIEFLASGRAVMSVGPNLPQSQAHKVAGDFGTPTVTLAAAPPRGRPAVAIHAAAHVQSSNPPSPEVEYRIDYSTDAGETWKPIVDDWRITRRGDEPGEFWSQSFCWGQGELDEPTAEAIQVRFQNTGGKPYLRAELHLVYEPPSQDATEVTFSWSDASGEHVDSHRFASEPGKPEKWKLTTGAETKTRWVEYRPVSRSGHQN